ncbi:MAG: MBL fold metallo-hydrolase [Candidatus Limnocylindria bacterium]
MAVVELRVLGSGDAFGTDGRFQACIWLRAGTFQALIDCGGTSLLAMHRFGIEPGEIDAILISHFHGDHVGGVPYLILDGQFRARTRALLIAGPPRVADRLRAQMDAAFPGSSETRQRFAVTYRELGASPLAIGPLNVRSVPVAHTPGADARGLRIQIGARSIAYSGDTEWTEALPALAAGADLLICEAYSFTKRIPYHLDYLTMRQHRDALRARRILLTHLGPELLARRAEVSEEIAEDGMTTSL